MLNKPNNKTYKGKDVALTTARVAICAVDDTRAFFQLYNDGPGIAYITHQDSAVGKTSIPVGQGLVLKDPAPKNAVYAWSASTSALAVVEA